MKQWLWVIVVMCGAVLMACGGGGNSPQTASTGSGATSATAPLCAPGTSLPFDYKKAANVKDADGKALGADGATTLIRELGDEDSVCGLAVSPDSQKVLDDAHALVQQGKKAEAKALIDAETTRVLGLPNTAAFQFGTRGMSRAVTDKDKTDQKVRDLVALAGGSRDAGDDGSRQLAEAQALYGPKLEERLKSADWQEAIRIAAEAEKLGLADLQKRAIARAKDEVVKMGDAARKNFDVCLATDEQMKKMVTLLALAQMMEVGAAGIQTITGVLSDTAAANILLHTNKLPPECARWSIKVTTLSELRGNGAAFTDTATWTGTFSVARDGKVAGTGVGLWTKSVWSCIRGSTISTMVVTLESADGTVAVGISGQEKDDTFHLVLDAKLKVNSKGCRFEDDLAELEYDDVIGYALVMFEEETGEAAFVVPVKDGGATTREYSESGATFKVTITLTKRPGGGN